MSEEYFFDTYAIIELIRENKNYGFVKDKIIITSSMNLAELYYSILLEKNEETAKRILSLLNLEILEITSDISIEAASFRFKNKRLKLSYIDCVGYILAKENNLLFLTGDKGFENMPNVEFVKK